MALEQLGWLQPNKIIKYRKQSFNQFIVHQKKMDNRDEKLENLAPSKSSSESNGAGLDLDRSLKVI